MAGRRFGIQRLYPEQERAMEAVLSGRDTLVVLPTGYGKSLIYQVPALLVSGPVLVVSPLIALMQDQEKKLRTRNVPVVRLDSTLKAAERRAALERVAEGRRLVVLTTPETLENEQTGAVLAQGKPSLLCVDEAHCISEWGHDFRPAYLRLGAARQRLAIPTVLALTATATPHVRDDISKRLGLVDPVLVVTPPDRANLRLGVEMVTGDDRYQVAARLIKRLRRPGIVYCATIGAVDSIYNALRRARIPCEKYHGKMKTPDRKGSQKRFMHTGRRKVMVATSAFGMGIDKADIRFVVHFQTPGSLEQYVQEAGRAGRDGRPSHCILIFEPADLEIQRLLQRTGRPGPAQLRRVAEALSSWEEPVGIRALALAASVPQTQAGAAASELEEAGLLVRDNKRRYQSSVTTEVLVAAAEELAGRYDTLKDEDARRLDAMRGYAETEECRSIYIRRWFGESDPPRCGRCDRCRDARAAALDRAHPARSGPIVEDDDRVLDTAVEPG